MPEFSPGESKTAIVVMTNPTIKAFDYVAGLYMGTNLALMASADFHLEAGKSKDISLPATMPSVVGTYPVHIGVFSDGESIDLYKAREDVVIVAPVLPFDMSITKIDTEKDKFAEVPALAYWLMEVTCQISNPHSVPISHDIYCVYARAKYVDRGYRYDRCWGGAAPGTPREQLHGLSVTLDPGESITLISPFYYIDDWNDFFSTYEWINDPPGMLYGGIRVKYLFKIIDEQGNCSPVASVGTHV